MELHRRVLFRDIPTKREKAMIAIPDRIIKVLGTFHYDACKVDNRTVIVHADPTHSLRISHILIRSERINEDLLITNETDCIVITVYPSISYEEDLISVFHVTELPFRLAHHIFSKRRSSFSTYPLEQALKNLGLKNNVISYIESHDDNIRFRITDPSISPIWVATNVRCKHVNIDEDSSGSPVIILKKPEPQPYIFRTYRSMYQFEIPEFRMFRVLTEARLEFELIEPDFIIVSSVKPLHVYHILTEANINGLNMYVIPYNYCNSPRVVIYYESSGSSKVYCSPLHIEYLRMHVNYTSHLFKLTRLLHTLSLYSNVTTLKDNNIQLSKEFISVAKLEEIFPDNKFEDLTLNFTEMNKRILVSFSSDTCDESIDD